MERVKEDRFVYLTTKGRKTGKPHTVELWFAIAERKVYLSHEGERTDWMKNAMKEKVVTIKVDGVTSKAKVQIAKESAREVGKKALYEKYYEKASQEVIDDWFDLSEVVELTLLS